MDLTSFGLPPKPADPEACAKPASAVASRAGARAVGPQNEHGGGSCRAHRDPIDSTAAVAGETILELSGRYPNCSDDFCPSVKHHFSSSRKAAAFLASP